ncbi:MAG: homoserine dehydrogenase [Acidobacteriota bacterium]
METKLAFVGFGNVARAFARMLYERREDLACDYDFRFRATAISTAHHGSILSLDDIDLLEAAERVERGENLNELKGCEAVADSFSLIEHCDADILFETSPLNPRDAEPAASYIRRALDRRIHVVTANKGPVAFCYRELNQRARELGVSFRFEGTVMDGAPVFNLVEKCLPAARVLGFEGVLNSTTNIILTGMEEGRPFEECLLAAQRAGIAEANADYDIDGWDAAMKAAALANVLTDAHVDPRSVKPRGIRDVSRETVSAAAREGRVIRLIARGERVSGEIKIRVAPEEVMKDSPFGSLRGASNLLRIKTDLMGEIAILETDPGVSQTAYALLSDMLTVFAGLRRS